MAQLLDQYSAFALWVVVEVGGRVVDECHCPGCRERHDENLGNHPQIPLFVRSYDFADKYPTTFSSKLSGNPWVSDPHKHRVVRSSRHFRFGASHMSKVLGSAIVLISLLLADVSLAREVVRFSGTEMSGTIVVRTNERRLYLVTEPGKALRYAVGVGRTGKHWYGSTSIVRKQLQPSWSPPAEIRGNRPSWVVPGGSPKNPMGAAALVLADNELAIHGTNNPGSIGGFVSWGCIRMHNRDIMELYERVSVGTRVVLTK